MSIKNLHLSFTSYELCKTYALRAFSFSSFSNENKKTSHIITLLLFHSFLQFHVRLRWNHRNNSNRKYPKIKRASHKCSEYRFHIIPIKIIIIPLYLSVQFYKIYANKCTSISERRFIDICDKKQKLQCQWYNYLYNTIMYYMKSRVNAVAPLKNKTDECEYISYLNHFPLLYDEKRRW